VLLRFAGRSRFSTPKRLARACGLGLLLAGARAGAQAGPNPAGSAAPLPPPPPPPSDEAAGTGFDARFVLETGRVPASRSPHFSAQIHGEYQLRVAGMSALSLREMPDPPATARIDDRLRVEHWLRVTPRLTLTEDLEIVAQLDVPRGFIAGQRVPGVDTRERDDYGSREPFGVDPRWLFLEWRPGVGTLRIGQQPAHWGMGLLVNDGDHPTLFGDYSGGTRLERVLFEVKPGGTNSPLTLGIASDLVFRDARSKLTDGDLAMQAVLMATYADARGDRVGFYGAYRHERPDSGSAVRATESVLVLDSAGKFNAKIPGAVGHVFGEYEIAYLVGQTDLSQVLIQGTALAREDIRALGAAARLGFVHTRGRGLERWGRFVAQVEWGWASGDGRPGDGSFRRFRFDPSYNVGLILFDQVLALKTARARNIGRAAGLDVAPGIDQLPSDGAVVGASYINPTLVFRPRRELDIKAGLVIAQTTSDFVDPVELGGSGRLQNYDGGSSQKHDLGLELDGGVEYRYAIVTGRLIAQFGAQAGVFFPGGALSGPTGDRLSTQYVGIARAGLQY
jgi:hypothetical protein